MLQILIYFFIAISLSIDAFSLALSLGTISPTKFQIIKLSLIVGIFHFIMPMLGCYFGNVISNKISLSYNFVSFLIFVYLAIELYKNKAEETKYNYLNLGSIILIALTVSIDSFSVGIAIGMTKETILLASFIFMIISSFSTLIGLFLGTKLKNKYQEKATLLGIILLLLTAIKFLFDC